MFGCTCVIDWFQLFSIEHIDGGKKLIHRSKLTFKFPVPFFVVVLHINKMSVNKKQWTSTWKNIFFFYNAIHIYTIYVFIEHQRSRKKQRKYEVNKEIYEMLLCLRVIRMHRKSLMMLKCFWLLIVLHTKRLKHN